MTKIGPFNNPETVILAYNNITSNFGIISHAHSTAVIVFNHSNNTSTHGAMAIRMFSIVLFWGRIIIMVNKVITCAGVLLVSGKKFSEIRENVGLAL